MFFKKIPRHNVNLTKKEILRIFEVMFKEDVLEGKYIDKFEDKFSRYIGTKHAIAVSSGRFALYLILKSLNIRREDEIIVPSYTVHIVPNIIRLFKAKPIFVDVDERTFNINPKLIKGKITKKTKAILSTHLYGQPCDMDSIIELAEKQNLLIIEDCGQACGAEYKNRKTGSFGNANFFSFAIGKNLTTFDGGMITTNDDLIAKKIREEIEKCNFPAKLEMIRKIFLYLFVWILNISTVFSFTIYPLLYVSDFFDTERISDYQSPVY